MRIKLVNLSFLIFLSGCGELVYSPYASNVEAKNINKNNLKKILNLEASTPDDFKVAVISDSHNYYDELEDQINFINKHDVSFVIHVGDATDIGIVQEWDFFLDIMNDLKVPYLLVPGNHDLLTNGYNIFEKLYGNTFNTDFEFKDIFFMLINTNNWESSGAVPDTNYLSSALNSTGKSRKFVFAHVPFDDRDRFSKSKINEFKNIIQQENTSYIFNGHNHNPSTKIFGNAQQITVGASSKEKVLILNISNLGVTHEFYDI